MCELQSRTPVGALLDAVRRKDGREQARIVDIISGFDPAGGEVERIRFEVERLLADDLSEMAREVCHLVMSNLSAGEELDLVAV